MATVLVRTAWGTEFPMDDHEVHRMGYCGRPTFVSKAKCHECQFERALEFHRQWDQIGLGYPRFRKTEES